MSLPTEPESPRYSALRYDSEYPPIGYSDTPKHNAFARLQERMNRGEVKLEWKAPRGYLDSLLKALNLDPSSQTLVFSKTSLEISFINDKTPRAIYFDDETYVAFVQGAPALELMAVDSVIGPVFYTLPNRDPKMAARLDRETLRCLNCHDSFSLMGGGVPHFLMVSTYAGVEGERSQRNASIDTNDATPMKNRWGGWYVTGQSGSQQHLGNVVIRTQQDLDNVDALRKGNLNSCRGCSTPSLISPTRATSWRCWCSSIRSPCTTSSRAPTTNRALSSRATGPLRPTPTCQWSRRRRVRRRPSRRCSSRW